MAETDAQTTILSSVVVVPEPDNLDDAASTQVGHSHKRRQTSSSNLDTDIEVKRRRLSQEAAIPSPGASTAALSPTGESTTATYPSTNGDRRTSKGMASAEGGGLEEQRKRGKRLFGSLIGTLSQSSSSSSSMMMKQKTRADIDRKQQEKLRLQDTEYSQAQKKRLDELTDIRTKEQARWDEESMRISRSNLLDKANFLTTTASPTLYYKPRQLRSNEKTRIQDQVKEAEKQRAQRIEEQKDTKQLDQSKSFGEPQVQVTSSVSQRQEGGSSESMIINTNAAGESPQNPANDSSSILADNPDQGSYAERFEQETVKDLGQDPEEVVVEAEEDAVIW